MKLRPRDCNSARVACGEVDFEEVDGREVDGREVDFMAQYQEGAWEIKKAHFAAGGHCNRVYWGNKSDNHVDKKSLLTP